MDEKRKGETGPDPHYARFQPSMKGAVSEKGVTVGVRDG